MTRNEFETISLPEESINEEYEIPLDISDIINICKDFHDLGHLIQNQIENLIEFGIEDSIINNYVKKESLPRIKYFLQKIGANPYFGDSRLQSIDLIEKIENYEEKHKINYHSNLN